MMCVVSVSTAQCVTALSLYVHKFIGLQCQVNHPYRHAFMVETYHYMVV